MMLITVEQLAAATGARWDRAQEALAGLVEAMTLYSINTPRRVAMFLANIGHETLGLRYLEELWGPTEQQKRYERCFMAPWPASSLQARASGFERNRLAFALGNIELGDGRRFAGHGYLQVTGRDNHARARDRLRARFPTLGVPDFEADPLQLADRRWAAIAAADYVERVGANQVADRGEFDAYCDLVNLGRRTEAVGDSNGYTDRKRLFAAVREGEVFA